MSAAIPLLVATTAANTGFPVGGFNASEYDGIVLCTNTGAMDFGGLGEQAKVYVLDVTGTRRALINPATGTQYVIAPGNTGGAIALPGGYLYQFDKTGTAASVGFDVLVKPRAAYAA